MEEDFRDFLKSYLNQKFKTIVNTKEGKMEVDLSNEESFAEFLEKFEKEIINVNINLLYAYHQWLKDKK